MRRYDSTPKIKGGRQRGTSTTVATIRSAVSSGRISYREIVMQEDQRLDVLAGIEYGDSTLWWVIAAASNIGWGLQVPADTLIRIPRLVDVQKVI
jgi:hypothetical protein